MAQGGQPIFILPEGTFRPTTAIKTYFFSITNQNIEEIEVGTLELVKDQFEPKGLKKIKTQERKKKKNDKKLCSFCCLHIF